MNMHKNARLTPAGRALLVRRVSMGWRAQAAADAAGVSVRTARKWIGRHRLGGERRLHDRSSAPGRCPHRTSAERIGEIARLRRERLTGAQIAQRLGMARSTVGAILRRLGLGRLALLEPKAPAIRYERKAPGEMIHLDIKTLGRIEGVGHRITGYREGCHRARGAGYEHLHVAVDDASRLAYVEILPSLGQQDATGFLQRALAWYARIGVAVQRVMTDNGSAYRSKLFATALRQNAARHIRTRPYTPRTNGKAERFIQSALREWAYARPYTSSAQRTRAAADWINTYNLQRPHAGIAGLTPWQRVNNLLGNNT